MFGGYGDDEDDDFFDGGSDEDEPEVAAEPVPKRSDPPKSGIVKKGRSVRVRVMSPRMAQKFSSVLVTKHDGRQCLYVRR